MDYLSQLLSGCKDSYWNSSKKHQRCTPLIMCSYDARDNLLFDKDLQTLKGGLLITGFSQSGKKEHCVMKFVNNWVKFFRILVYPRHKYSTQYHRKKSKEVIQ